MPYPEADILCMMSVTCLVVSNLIAGKIWAISDSITVPASVILFPVTYILADVFTPLYVKIELS